MIFYHEDKPGEVSHRAEAAYVRRTLEGTFRSDHGHLLYMMAYYPGIWIRRDRARGRNLCAPGIMASYLRAAAVRDATRGEG